MYEDKSESITLGETTEIAISESIQITEEIAELNGIATKEDDAAVIARLSALNRLEYDRARKDEATKMGVTLKTLDDAVKNARKGTTEDTSPFPIVDVYPEPIAPAQLLDDIHAACKRFVVLDYPEAVAVTLWIAHTWFIDVVHVSPLLIINAPEKACGKTQLLDYTARLSARAISAANSSTAYLFRSIELWQPTMFIDEVDTFMKENNEIKGIINAGHTRSSAFVGRVVGDNHLPTQFKVWGAKALAGIGLERHLPDATMSRGIAINMRRRKLEEKISSIRHEPANTFDLLASQLARFAQDYAAQVEAARPEFPEGLSDRSQDNWEPLFAIAQCGGDGWLELAKNAALALAKSTESHVSIGNELLADIQSVFNGQGIDKISTVDLIQELLADDESPWHTFNRGRVITPRNIASQLDKYGIKSRTVRTAKHSTPKGYYADDFQDAFARYLPQAVINAEV